ncbi:hypothetical protein VNI00_003420 [Paramarasmius palmivorus]|uniref:Uncharacterized protein n=1 Tax=Paramarasmius palmivorus TaxID=297713 RepID=A0AAW0DSU4_9AGAR
MQAEPVMTPSVPSKPQLAPLRTSFDYKPPPHIPIILFILKCKRKWTQTTYIRSHLHIRNLTYTRIDRFLRNCLLPSMFYHPHPM